MSESRTTLPGHEHRRKVTYVLPVFNEAASLPAFHEALATATGGRPDLDLDLDFEFVYVDDGSRRCRRGGRHGH